MNVLDAWHVASRHLQLEQIGTRAEGENRLQRLGPHSLVTNTICHLLVTVDVVKVYVGNDELFGVLIGRLGDLPSVRGIDGTEPASLDGASCRTA